MKKLRFTLYAAALIVCPAAASASSPIADWDFRQMGGICTADLQLSAGGSSITILKDTRTPNHLYVKLTNPSWKVGSSAEKELTIRYIALPYKDKAGILRPSLKIERNPLRLMAKPIIETVGERKQAALVIVMMRVMFDDIVDLADIGYRIAVYYEDSPLTTWMNVNKRVQSNLDNCTDPFG